MRIVLDRETPAEQCTSTDFHEKIPLVAAPPLRFSSALSLIISPGNVLQNLRSPGIRGDFFEVVGGGHGNQLMVDTSTSCHRGYHLYRQPLRNLMESGPMPAMGVSKLLDILYSFLFPYYITTRFEDFLKGFEEFSDSFQSPGFGNSASE